MCNKFTNHALGEANGICNHSCVIENTMNTLNVQKAWEQQLFSDTVFGSTHGAFRCINKTF